MEPQLDSTHSEHAGTASVLLGLSNSVQLHNTPTRSQLDTFTTSSLSTSSTSRLSSPFNGNGAAFTATLQGSTLAARRRSQVSALPRKEWSAQEDELIRDGVQQLGCRWRVIAAKLPGRSDDAVRNRWSRLQENMRAREGNGPAGSCGGRANGGGSSSSRASAGAVLIRSGADGSGAGSSSSSSMGLSCGESSPPHDKGKKERSSWTRVEDDIIIQGVHELGHKWYEIARRLPGRTDHAIRNRWSRLQSIIGQHDVQRIADTLARQAASLGGVRPAPPAHLPLPMHMGVMSPTGDFAYLNAALKGGLGPEMASGATPNGANALSRGKAVCAGVSVARSGADGAYGDGGTQHSMPLLPFELPRDADSTQRGASTLKASPSAANLCLTLAMNGQSDGSAPPRRGSPSAALQVEKGESALMAASRLAVTRQSSLMEGSAELMQLKRPRM
uniref:Uncharacterized protein n=1 Tax=Calcidiscus leptoporus TaxID=127549 RepID=A0A7S0P4F2_9EUKA|mmetsp:Transcript_57800/g.132752  ORF Transcript_57800/g.132752 Transcript_57800/m.132752 type:complete len:446 (+) Transcript_57800:162-1499(+)